MTEVKLISCSQETGKLELILTGHIIAIISFQFSQTNTAARLKFRR